MEIGMYETTLLKDYGYSDVKSVPSTRSWEGDCKDFTLSVTRLGGNTYKLTLYDYIELDEFDFYGQPVITRVRNSIARVCKPSLIKALNITRKYIDYCKTSMDNNSNESCLENEEYEVRRDGFFTNRMTNKFKFFGFNDRLFELLDELKGC